MDIYDFIENHFREMKEFTEKYERYEQGSEDFDPAEEFRNMVSRWCEGNDMVAKMFILAAVGYDYGEGGTSQIMNRVFHLVEDEKILKKLEYIEGFRDYHVVEFNKQDLE